MLYFYIVEKRETLEALSGRFLGAFALRLGKRPALRFFVLAISLGSLTHAAARLIGYAGFPQDWKAVSVEMSIWVVALVVMALCTLVCFAALRHAWYYLAISIKIVFLVVYLLTVPPVLGTEYPLLTAVVMEIAMHEPYPRNLFESIIVVTVSAAVRAANPAFGGPPQERLERYFMNVWIPQLEFLFYPLAIAVSWCLLLRFSQLSSDLQENIARLDSAVGNLSKATLGYQHYASEAAAQSQREERLRITRELHDIIGYTFTNNIMMLEAAVSKISKDPKRVEKLIELARENAQTGLEKIRNSLYLLRSYEPPRTTSVNRIHNLVRVFHIATGIQVLTEYSNTPDTFGDEVEAFLYHFLQEAFTNAFRHGQATRIRVYLFHTGDRLVVSVVDNGRGSMGIREGIGITGMRERLAKLGGTLRIECPPKGFEIVGEIPYPREALRE